MSLDRRNFLESLFSAGLSGQILSKLGPSSALAEILQQSESGPTGSEQDSYAFWSEFLNPISPSQSFHLTKSDPSSLSAAGGRPGGSGDKNQKGIGSDDSNRQVDFLYCGKDGLRYVSDISNDELQDFPGDIAMSVNVGGLRMSVDDRGNFERLKSAQLRIDVLQSRSLLNILDKMAWTALAALFPDESGKLPPLQNLSFDPATTLQNMQKVVVPGGMAHLAINVSMMRRESDFLRFLKIFVNETGRFAPVLGLPAISLTALSAFSSLYGALEKRTTFLMQSKPVMAFLSKSARVAANTNLGMNLLLGDYVLVPAGVSKLFKPYLDRLTLKEGYLVEKGASRTESIYSLAQTASPDVTYITINVGAKPLVQ
jgi:hypothetical protein